GLTAITQHERELTDYALFILAAIPGVRILPAPLGQAGVISLVMAEIHPHDIATILNAEGIAVRAGHHCAMPLMARLQVPGTVRVSLGLYNTREDIDRLAAAMKIVRRYV